MSNPCKHGTQLEDRCDMCIEENTAFPDVGGLHDSVESEEPAGRIQVGFDVVELQRVSLQPGDVLMVTVKNDDMDHASLNALRSALREVFPDNKIFVFGMGTADDVKLSIIGQESVAKTENVGYCNNCNCGKKERAEQTLEGESDGRSQSESSGESSCGNQCSGSCSER